MATFTGTNASETIAPNFVSPTVVATGGGPFPFPSNDADIINSGGGDDGVEGGGGADQISLGSGFDDVFWKPGDGNDVIDGGSDFDTLEVTGQSTPGSGAIELFTVSANGSHALLTRNVDNVTLDLNSIEAIEIDALGGDDVVAVGDLTGTGLKQVRVDLSATPGLGDNAFDEVRVFGTGGNDSIIVSGITQDVRLELELDVTVAVLGGEGSDLLRVVAGGGNDVIDATSLAGGAIQLLLSGGDGDDSVFGSRGADNAGGGAGHDLIFGFDGDDLLFGNCGNDSIDGGAGENLLNGGTGDDYVAADANLNVAHGAEDNDQLYFTGVQNQLFGGTGADWLGVNGTNNALVGGAGDEVFMGASGSSNTLDGQEGNDLLFANGTGNFLHGGTGNDWVGVSGSNNTLFGEAGSDYVAATGNNCRLDGGAGNDTLEAAVGHVNDVFVFHAGYGQDTLLNFSVGGGDVVNLETFGLASFAALQPFMAQVGSDVVITLNGADILTMQNVALGTLSANDFDLV